jgi:tRNA-splicing endonuclease subunit Sen2
MGFFGKGSLSRSEPEWLDQEQKRRGVDKKDTSWEITQRRREERKQFKLDRARQGREALKQKLKEEALAANSMENASKEVGNLENGPVNGSLNGHLKKSKDSPNVPVAPDAKELEDKTSSVDEIIINGNSHIAHKSPPDSTASSENGNQTNTRDDVSTRSSSSSKTVRFSPTVERLEFEIPTPIDNCTTGLPQNSNLTSPPIQNQEHLQLTYEEAFFLGYGLGVLQVYDSDLISPLPTSALLHRFLRSNPSQSIDPDNPFLLSYITYHHFRSLGWTVRPGAKFSVDYLLYNRGPVFSHAEFGVIVLPSYSDPYWMGTETGRAKVAKNEKERERKSWWWLHCVNRVQAAVQKNLVICYVEVPPPVEKVGMGEEDGDIDIGAFLRRYKVREINIKRWSPNRMR